ncbi:DUF3261 domain-containing protein [Photobacterium sp. SDRW27]|uniref:DUF3261 domain-containing protein n=1 Tax=Photobacterium obscurum TaxID=2829490 RepID=UPI002243D946|nr:DUF3261 domain-containing protein [Photobacterium obscurum]MCW8328970.1 DUF3261 domain-containing protein [Photobacterium obscurum]
MIEQLKLLLFTGFLLAAMTGCVSTSAPQQPLQNQVEIAPGTRVTLPEPAELGETLTASQLISAQWQDQTNQLPVQLEVSPDKVVLAGFSSWGSRILSLSYQNKAIETQVLPGLGETLPKPEQVLFNLMLTLWPAESWEQPLMASGWQLKETSQYRQLIDDKGNIVIEIHYNAMPHLDGEILFTNKKLGYVISIKTLNYSR